MHMLTHMGVFMYTLPVTHKPLALYAKGRLLCNICTHIILYHAKCIEAYKLQFRQFDRENFCHTKRNIPISESKFSLQKLCLMISNVLDSLMYTAT